MSEQSGDSSGFLGQMLALQSAAMRKAMDVIMPSARFQGLQPAEVEGWLEATQQLQQLWLDFQTDMLAEGFGNTKLGDPSRWASQFEAICRQVPFANAETQQRMWEDGVKLWEGMLGQFGLGPNAVLTPEGLPELPRKDRRFADPRWRSQPVFAILHQTYLMMAEQIEAAVGAMDGIADDKREQLKFAVRSLIETLSPANFAMTNPVAIERALETRGQSLVKGMEHLLADLRRGQLSHTSPDAFTLGEDLAVTPGKVVHETPLYQLIQYSPTTETVIETPLVIFPPWINRFFILDLTPRKSFVQWAVDRGLTVFIVSWKSADESMAQIVWDDYIAGMIEVIDHVRSRLKVSSVHTIGYCVAGTTLAAMLAILARRGEADKVKSATFFTAQVDFEAAGELKVLCDDATLELADQLAAGKGYLDGRFMAAAFNALRGQDLIWNYVVRNYLMGEDYQPFDLLYWNGQTTNLPARWHHNYVRDLYRDNKLVVPDALSACGTPIDLTHIETPAYVQAGREDHIAPPESVFQLMHHLKGPTRFILAGSGHIAGVVNPPAAGKYQYWTNEAEVASLDEFIAGATEHPGSWWPDWIEWIASFGDKSVRATGKRKPGGRGDKVIEDAPGRYVRMP